MLNNLFLCQYGASRCSFKANINPPQAEEQKNRLCLRCKEALRLSEIILVFMRKLKQLGSQEKTHYLVGNLLSKSAYKDKEVNFMKKHKWLVQGELIRLLFPFRRVPGGFSLIPSQNIS